MRRGMRLECANGYEAGLGEDSPIRVRHIVAVATTNIFEVFMSPTLAAANTHPPFSTIVIMGVMPTA
jgi:hypothetical protein